MQPLQMRFIVTKESIANVYSVIKSESAEQRIYIIPANLLLPARGTRNNFVKTSNRNLPEIIQNVRIFTLCPNCRCWWIIIVFNIYCEIKAFKAKSWLKFKLSVMSVSCIVHSSATIKKIKIITIAGVGVRWQVQNLVFLPGHGLCDDLHSGVFPQTLCSSRQVMPKMIEN